MPTLILALFCKNVSKSVQHIAVLHALW